MLIKVTAAAWTGLIIISVLLGLRLFFGSRDDRSA